jgi:hypothetical protein
VETILNVLETTASEEQQDVLSYFAWTGFAQLTELGDTLRISQSSYEGLVNFGYEKGTPSHIFHGFVEAKVRRAPCFIHSNAHQLTPLPTLSLTQYNTHIYTHALTHTHNTAALTHIPHTHTHTLSLSLSLPLTHSRCPL